MSEVFCNDGHCTVALHDRRTISRRFLIVGGVTTLYPVFGARVGFAQQGAIILVQNNLGKTWMARAGELKQMAVDSGDQAYGAVIVKDGKIVGEGPSRVVTNHDATAHAEMEAIRDASRRLGTGDLAGCVLYGTSKPCRMCETAAYWANISRFVYGSEVVDAGAPTYSSC